MILIKSFTGSMEPGLTPEHIDTTPGQIQSFSQDLYNYITHVQVANAEFMIGLGIMVTAPALFGIRRGEDESLWTAFLATVVALMIAIPLHYPFQFATLGHPGLFI